MERRRGREYVKEREGEQEDSEGQGVVEGLCVQWEIE
jgi:hypothetical protein